MLETEELLNGLSPELVLRFFATFARMEFALKHCGCLRTSDEGETAQIGLNDLVARLGAAFVDTVRNSDLAASLVQSPPRHFRVNAAGGVQFEDQPAPITTTNDLVGATWRVRNNLFHGNKMFPANRERDELLMIEALAVIGIILDQLPDVSAAYHEPQPFY